MREPLKIDILDVNNRNEVKQAYYLFEKCVITQYMQHKYRGKRELLESETMQEAFDEYHGKCNLHLLTEEDIKIIKCKLEPQVFYKECLISIDNNTENRCYILKDEDKIVGFQIVQLTKDKKGKMRGNITQDKYIESEYNNKSGGVIDNNGKLYIGIYNGILYMNIDKWFKKNNVSYKRVLLNVDMLPEIRNYIETKGFLPYDKNDKWIYLEKYEDYPIDIKTLETVYKMYVENLQRKDEKTFEELFVEINERIGDGLNDNGNSHEKQIIIMQRKQNLVRVFMKSKEREMFDLNNLIYDCWKNREDGIDYDLLYKCSVIMYEKLKIKKHDDNRWGENFSDIENTKKIALEFFKSIDQELYEKAKSIVDGNSDIGFEAYKFDDNNNNKPTKFCVGYSDEKGKLMVYIPYRENIKDIYSLVHELSHTFDLGKDPPTRQMIGELTPFCFELMLDYYLIEQKKVDEKDVANRQKFRIENSYICGMNTLVKSELVEIVKNRDIEEGDIIELQKKYKLNDKQIKDILDEVIYSERNVHFQARYMIAQLICLRYIEQYDKNPQEAIKTLKEYFELVKKDDFVGSLEKIGVNTNLDEIESTIAELATKVNERYKEVEKIINVDNKPVGNTRNTEPDTDDEYLDI